MSDRLSWMLLSFPLPQLGSLKIRVSWFFLLLAFVFAIRFPLALALTVVGILLVSVLLHELGHVAGARLTGGSAHEIHLTPLGGLAFVQPGRGTLSQVMTTAAGPCVNLLICLAVFSSGYAPEARSVMLNPLILPLDPIGALSGDRLLLDLGLITFAVNWLLLLINLLPIVPLDGGHLLKTLLATRIHPELVNRAAFQVGVFFSGLLMLVGLFGDWSPVVFVGAILLLINMVQLLGEQTSELLDDSFLGYDFSEGYTSLDRSAPTSSTPREAHLSPLQRWREQRRLRREHEERQQQVEAEQQLDGLLAKVHEHGMASLTAREQRLLQQVSDLLRERGKRPS
jgi:stage IV sporulation protein FB